MRHARGAMAFQKAISMETAEPLPGWRGRFWQSESMSFSRYEFSEGSSIHKHSHPEEEVWIVLEGKLEVEIDSQRQVAEPGDVAVVPGNCPHSVQVLTEGSAIVVNQPVRAHPR